MCGGQKSIDQQKEDEDREVENRKVTKNVIVQYFQARGL